MLGTKVEVPRSNLPSRPAGSGVPTAMLIALLLLILATLVAGPIGFIVVGALLIAWALLTGSLHLIYEILALPFRIVGALAGRNRRYTL